MKNVVVLVLSFLFMTSAFSKKVLIVVTNHSKLGDTGVKTGYYLPEVTHPFYKFKEAGLDVDFASPKGGEAPMDEKSRDLSDPMNKRFLENEQLMKKLSKTIPLEKINPSDYAAIVFAGGHGTMWDFKDSKWVQKVASRIYEKGGVVAAVCHGPAALVDIKLSNGKFLIEGKSVTGFTNEEEEIVKLTKVMPFLLETSLKKRGANFSKASPWKSHVIVDQRVVTGQNPASAGELGKRVVALVQKK